MGQNVRGLLWVKLRHRLMPARSPLYPQKPTFSSTVGKSEKCQGTKSLRDSPLRG